LLIQPIQRKRPDSNGWLDGYLTGDGLAPNGNPVTSGIIFPDNATEGDYVLRLDYSPNRLFRYNNTRWIKVEDEQRTSLTPGIGNTQLSGFINNTNTTTTDDNKVIDERIDLNTALSIKADNK